MHFFIFVFHTDAMAKNRIAPGCKVNTQSWLIISNFNITITSVRVFTKFYMGVLCLLVVVDVS